VIRYRVAIRPPSRPLKSCAAWSAFREVDRSLRGWRVADLETLWWRSHPASEIS
jgi:hypothetical protein